MITIIGAGPVGCYVASLLADEFEVAVFEEHSSVGLPVQCTGILTAEVFKYLPKNHESIINQVRKVKIFSQSKVCLELDLNAPDIIVDRHLFDSYFYEKARNKGVKFFLNHRFMGVNNNRIIVKDLKSGRTKNFKFDYLIGADGPLSPVAKAAGLFRKREFFIGIQAVVRKNNNNIIDFYPLKNGFGWAVPENKNILRMGVACRSNPKERFISFLEKYKGKIIARQGGLIPLFNPKLKPCTDKVFLVGDAAGFVKATTGGGIIPGLKSAELLAYSLKYNTSYESELYLHLYPSLLVHLVLRKMLDGFSEKDWDELVKELSTPKVRRVLQSINRDKIFLLLLKLGINKPSLVKYFLKFSR